MIRVRGMLKGDAFKRYPEAFIACLKGGWIEASLKAVSDLFCFFLVYMLMLFVRT